MTVSSIILAANAKTPPAEAGGEKAETGVISQVLRNLLAELFPIKTWGKVAAVLGLSDRGARHRMEGTRAFSADELAALLRTEHGYRVLTAVMADAAPSWWRICAPLMEVAEIQQMQIAARRRLQRVVKGALDADAELSAAIARADALCDPDFHRPHADGLRAMARLPDRAVASAAGKGRGRR